MNIPARDGGGGGSRRNEGPDWGSRGPDWGGGRGPRLGAGTKLEVGLVKLGAGEWGARLGAGGGGPDWGGSEEWGPDWEADRVGGPIGRQAEWGARLGGRQSGGPDWGGKGCHQSEILHSLIFICIKRTDILRNVQENET